MTYDVDFIKRIMQIWILIIYLKNESWNDDLIYMQRFYLHDPQD